MYLSKTYPESFGFDIRNYLKKYFDLFALKDDQEAERKALEEKQQKERDDERVRLDAEAEDAREDREEAEKREQKAKDEAQNL